MDRRKRSRRAVRLSSASTAALCIAQTLHSPTCDERVPDARSRALDAELDNVESEVTVFSELGC